MSENIRPRKRAMWEFFNENPSASSPVELGRLEDLSNGYRKAAQLCIDALEGRRKVIDVGCGTGFPALYVAEHVDKIVGIDTAPNMIAAARDNAARLDLKNITFLVADATDLPFADEEFDGTSVLGVLESMDWDDAHRMMGELRRVLAPGGRVAIFEQDWADVMRRRPALQIDALLRNGKLMLRHVERTTQPGLEKDTRYLIDPQSSAGHRLLDELAGKERAATALRPDELAPADVLDAWYDEGAQFDAESLAELAVTHGFSNVAVDLTSIWNESMLFLTAGK